MGWPGIVLLGWVVGLSGWWLNPLRRAGRTGATPLGRVWVAALAGVLAAALAKMMGDIVGAYHDGDSLEWLACALFSFAAVSISLGVASRRT